MQVADAQVEVVPQVVALAPLTPILAPLVQQQVAFLVVADVVQLVAQATTAEVVHEVAVDILVDTQAVATVAVTEVADKKTQRLLSSANRCNH